MQYGRALDRLICEIVYADPALGYVLLLKTDVSDGFYRIGLRPEDAPKLGLIIPSGADEEPMVAIPLTLPTGWKNFPPILSTATETVADLANKSLHSHQRISPRMPGASFWGAAGIGHGSIWRVPLLAVAPSVVLPLLPCRPAYAICLADGDGGIR